MLEVCTFQRQLQTYIGKEHIKSALFLQSLPANPDYRGFVGSICLDRGSLA
ncbi:hypothetical protein PHLCEN_2v6909 [Hermanssonia centrifuga]|uniref:Uncharacterized protein n=1 Tax=Hermanssonia centrifuga TaxID=98765 RepID=A0A2R6NY02_9APHY|nr:hypothetical protein PHLCEN_2v6909 [Hermanssonia centrifuga]